MFSPDATKGVMTWAYSPPSRNSVLIASPATSHSRTPSATAAVAEAVTASASAVASWTLDLLGKLDPARRLHRRVAVLHLELREMRRERFGENST